MQVWVENLSALHAQTCLITEAVENGSIAPEAYALLEMRAKAAGRCPLDVLYAAVGVTRKTG